MSISKDTVLLIFGKKRLPNLINYQFKRNNNKLKKEDFDKLLLKYVQTGKKFKTPGFKFNPDLMFYIYSNLNLQPVFEIKNKNIKSMYSIDNKDIHIRQQHWFTYCLLKNIKKNIKSRKKNANSYTKTILSSLNKQLFKKNSQYNYFSFMSSIEKSRFVYDKPNPYRTDLEFKININENEYSIIIEYLEKRSHPDYKDWEIDELRLYKIIKSNKDVKKAFICTEKSIIDMGPKKWFTNFADKIVKLLLNLCILDDKDNFVINKLTMINGSKDFSEILYKSYRNKNKCIIDKELLEEIVKVAGWKNEKSKTEYWKFFIDICNIRPNYNDYDDSTNESDDESFSDSDLEEEHIINPYYNSETNQLSFHGLSHYFLCLETRYLFNNAAKLKLNKMYGDMIYEFISSLEEIYEKLKNNSNNLIEKM